jgi:hypothetical protein
MGHEKSRDQLVGDGQDGELQLGPQGEDAQGDLQDHKGSGGYSQSPDREISTDQEKGADSEGTDRKACGTSELAMAQNPFTQLTRRKALIHGPLAGHGGPHDALGQYQHCADDWQGEPPGGNGDGRALAGKTLVQTTDEEDEDKGRRQVSRDRG